MVDEAQDFDTSALEFCVELLEATEPDDQDLIIVADSAQNIFRKDFSWKSAGIKAQGRTRLLRVNYRNTREILEFAHSFLTADPSIAIDEAPDADDPLTVIPAESAERSGPPPTATTVDGISEEVAAIVDRLTERGAKTAPSRTFAVLTGEQTSDGYHARDIVDGLRNAGIPVFWVTDPGKQENKDHAGSADEPVIVSTIHSAKGLEFPDVTVCSLGGGGDDVTTARKLLYVGFTRAINTLSVFVTKDSPFLQDVMAASRQ